MRFSIIVCTYNASQRLSKALDSVLAQKSTNYEVIMVDGASTDGTQKIIEEYEKKFEGRLRWISEPDRGVYDAMNKGIDMARGEWIYFLGSDDALYSDDILEKIAEGIEKTDPDVIYGNVKWGNTEKIYYGKFSPLKLMRKNICHQALFFRKKIFQKFGKYDLKYKVLADHVFNMQWFNDKNIKREYVGLVIAKYNMGGQSSSSCAPDREFTKDRDKLMEKYFPKECVDFDKKRCQNEKLQQVVRELDPLKPSKCWKLWYYYLRIRSLFSKNQS